MSKRKLDLRGSIDAILDGATPELRARWAKINGHTPKDFDAELRAAGERRPAATLASLMEALISLQGEARAVE